MAQSFVLSFIYTADEQILLRLESVLPLHPLFPFSQRICINHRSSTSMFVLLEIVVFRLETQAEKVAWFLIGAQILKSTFSPHF